MVFALTPDFSAKSFIPQPSAPRRHASRAGDRIPPRINARGQKCDLPFFGRAR
jgi:hypothetical protein